MTDRRRRNYERMVEFLLGKYPEAEGLLGGTHQPSALVRRLDKFLRHNGLTCGRCGRVYRYFDAYHDWRGGLARVKLCPDCLRAKPTWRHRKTVFFYYCPACGRKFIEFCAPLDNVCTHCSDEFESPIYLRAVLTSNDGLPEKFTGWNPLEGGPEGAGAGGGA